MNFGNPEHERKLKHYIIALLVLEAQSDSDFSINEKKYLAYAGQALGVTEQEVVAIRLNPADYIAEPPKSEQERMNVLYYLLFMMRSDGTIKKEEEALCHHLGFQLGFRPELISDLINVMRDCLSKEIPPNAMIDKVRAYMN